MVFAKSLVLLLSVATFVNALATPNSLGHALHHRALAARVAAAAPVAVPVPALRKRQNTKRCKQRSSAIQPSATPASSSVPVLEPTSSKESAPKPTPKPAATPTPVKQAPPPAPTKKSSSSGGNSSNLPSYEVGTQTGQGTFYATGLGACGITNKDTDHIAAVSHLLFDTFPGYNGANPNNNPLCGKTVTATYQGKSVVVALTDRCTGCALTDLDFSPSAFGELADFAVGRISGMTWTWNDL